MRILVNDKEFELPEEIRVVRFDQPGGMSFVSHPACWSVRKEPVERVVLHWDCCLTSKNCFQVLVAKDCSSHFSIDFDGTIWQTLDPTMHRGVHVLGDNARSVGIDVCDPVEMKYDKKCTAQGHPRRILHKDNYPGFGAGQFLGLTESQVVSLRGLLPVLCQALRIPAAGPTLAERWAPIPGIEKRRGVFCHLNYPKGHENGKWDILGFPWSEVIV